MADAKGKTKSEKKAGAKGNSAKVEPEKPSEAAAEAVDLAKQDVAPDAKVTVLTKHAEALANTVERDAADLALVKLTADHATQLRDGATTLRDAETAWQKARAAGAAGTVADLRVALSEGREDIFGALRLFAPDAKTQATLDDIAGVDDDNDLDSDVARLLPLTTTHAAALVGTEVTPEHVVKVAETLTKLRAARAGTRKTRTDEETTTQALSGSALAAQRARNVAFWSLSALDRLVCARAGYRFRRDAKRAGDYTSYSVERGPRKPTTK